MNYKDLIGAKNPNFSVLAYIPDFYNPPKFMYMRPDYLMLYIYQVSEDKIIGSVGRDGIKEIYDIKSIDGKDYIVPNNDKYNQVCLDDMVILGIIGKINDNKIFPEFFRQGDIYKNEIVYENTKKLSKEDLDKLPLKDKICYIPKHAFDGKEYIDLSSKELKDGEDYYTIFGIKEDINNHYGKDIINKISEKDLYNMIEDVFDTLDWQYPSSLLDADNYLDGYIEKLGINLNDCEYEYE